MAAKIKEGIHDITQGLKERLGMGPKYADNLLGESLHDQLRKATAKELVQPSEELNSQVVDTINQDIANGKDTKEIISLLRKRLRTDNPHKQWLAVLLVGRVMRDCAQAVGGHTEELLQEVARTMARPARPDSDAAKVTRSAAKELLRSYGRAGTSAFRAAQRSNLEAASVGTAAAARSAGGAAANSEAASVLAEVDAIIEQAKTNTELLSDMLLAGQQQQQQAAGAGGAAAGAGPDEFENELVKELVTEVRELRSLFDAYLEQLQSLPGPEAEAAMLRALEAVDGLDGALALHADVASNQRELEQQAAAGGAAGTPQPAAASAAAAGGGGGDLISLDDLGDSLALPQPPPVLGGGAPAPLAVQQAQAAAAYDPFAASAHTVLSPIASPPGAAAPGVGVGAPPPPYGAPPAAQPYAAIPSPGQPYGQPPPPQPAYPAYGAAAPPPQPYAPTPGYPTGAAPAAAPPALNTNNPFAAAAAPAAPPPVYGAAPPPLASVPSNNPFAGAGSGGGASGPLAGTASGGATAAAAAATVDQEWALFFAGRTGPGAAGQPAQ